MSDVVDVLKLIGVVNHALGKRSRRPGRGRGVGDAERLTLWLLGHFRGISAERIAQVLGAHPRTVRRMLRDLERLGALTRSSGGTRSGRAGLELTAAGTALGAAPHDAGEALVHQVLERLPRPKVRAASEVLAAVSLALVGQEPTPAPRQRGHGAVRLVLVEV